MSVLAAAPKLTEHIYSQRARIYAARNEQFVHCAVGTRSHANYYLTYTPNREGPLGSARSCS